MLNLFSFLWLIVIRMTPGVFGAATTGVAHGGIKCRFKPDAITFPGSHYLS